MIAALLQRIEMDFEKIQKLRQPRGAESRVRVHFRQFGGHRPLNQAHRHQRCGIGGFDRSDLPTRPVIGQFFAEMLIVE
jgi:hypothetical protein